jgi:GNAT superfamily N-acetyltransferase
MIVRHIEEKDVGDVLNLIRAKADFDGCLATLKSKELEIQEAFLSPQPKAKALVAEVGDKVVGVVTYYDIYSTFLAKPGLWLDDLYIYNEFRGRGIGKRLMEALCNVALEAGCGRIDWIVARDNENGRSFYESIGAHIFEEVRHARLDENAIKKLAGIG